MYLNGNGVISQDDKKALELFTAAAAQGHAGSLCNVGWMLENGKGVSHPDLKGACEAYHLAALNREGGVTGTTRPLLSFFFLP